MGLSEEEQQKLAQMEQALYDTDPKFASMLGNASSSRLFKTRAAYGTLLVLLGLGALISSVSMNLVFIGVFGFICMLAGAVLIHSVWSAGRLGTGGGGFSPKDRWDRIRSN